MTVGEGTPPRGREEGHFHDDVGPIHFAKVIMAPRLDLLPKPDSFQHYLGPISRIIIVKTNTDCYSMEKLKDDNGRGSRLGSISIARDIKIGHFMTFKVLKGDVYKITIFDYSMNDVVKKRPKDRSNPWW
jgi:hypothetical protein